MIIPASTPQQPFQNPTNNQSHCKKYSSIIIAVLGVLFGLIALGADELSTDVYSSSCTGICHWDKASFSCDSEFWVIYYSSSDCTNSECGTVESAGNTWLAFGIIGLLIGIVSIILHIRNLYIKYYNYLYLASGICFFIPFLAWSINGCTILGSFWSTGSSPVLMIIASILTIISCIINCCNSKK